MVPHDSMIGTAGGRQAPAPLVATMGTTAARAAGRRCWPRAVDNGWFYVNNSKNNKYFCCAAAVLESCINFTRIWLVFVGVWDEITPSFLDGNLGDTATNALRGNGSARVGREWLRISFSSSWVVNQSNCAAAPTHTELNGLFTGYNCSKIRWEIGPSFFDAKYNLTWGRLH